MKRCFGVWLSVAAVLCVAISAQAATKTFDGGVSGTGSALDTAANWVGDALPGTSDEVLLDNSVITLPVQLTTTGNSPTYGDLIFNNNAASILTINTGTATSRTITLSGGGGSTAASAAGGATGDLILMGSTATANTLTIGGNAGAGSGRLNLVLGASGNINIVNSGATLVLSGVISESGGAKAITKTGAGTLTLSAANSYTGNTILDGGTLSYTTDNTGVKVLTFGGSAASANTSALDLSGANATATGLIVQNNSSTANTVTIGSGKTLTLTGSAVANVLAIGTSTAGAVNKLTISGGSGTLAVNDATRNIVVANLDITGTGASSQLDLSNLGTFTASIKNLYVGRPTTSTGTATTGKPLDSLALANTNSITASGVIALGGTAQSFNSGSSTLKLGTTNVLNSGSIVVGNARTSGTLTFNTGLTSPSVTIRGASGGSTRTSIYLGDQGNTTVTGNSSGGSTSNLGTMDFTGGTLDAKIESLYVGYGAADNNSGAYGQGDGAFLFDGTASSVDISTLVIGQSKLDSKDGTSKTTSTGTFTMNGGVLVINTTMTLANDMDDSIGTCVQGVQGTFNLMGGSATIGSSSSPVNVLLGNHNSTGTGAATATLGLTNGTLTVNGDIKQGALGSGTIVSTLTLNGATLDMAGHNIGISGALIGALSFQSGTLKNVAEINAGTTALTKTTGGTLTLSGVNNYSGDTTISAGKLVLSSSSSIANSANIAVAAGATCDVSAVTFTLGSSQTLKGTGTVIGNVTVAGTLAPGTDASNTGTLTNKGNVAFSTNGTNQVAVSGSSYSKLDLGGTGTFNGNNAILALPSSPPTGLGSMLIVTNAAAAGVSGQMIATNGTILSENASLSSYPGWSLWYVHYRSTYVELNKSSTPVVLLQLQALTLNGKVTVRWSTSSESKTAGFDLYRIVNGQSVKLNDSLIAAKGWPNGGIGASYCVADAGAQPGQTYSYKLVERTTDGQSLDYGPYDRTVSEFVMKPLEVTAAGAKVRWLSRTGENYRVLKSTDLTSGQYQPIAENIAATPPENFYLDTAPGSAGFYRIELQP